jgi:hypothetical protein
MAMNVGAVSQQQDKSHQQQLEMMAIQQKKADQDALVNALSAEIKADRDTKTTLARNLA